MSADRFTGARGLLRAAARSRAFPAAVIDVGTRSSSIWQEAFGTLSFDPGAPATRTDTWFDLASLTKVISTTSLAMRHVHAGRLALDDSLGRRLDGWGDALHTGIRIRHLLDHSAGLPAHARLFERLSGRRAFEAAIREMPLEHTPGTASVYSDVGFMVLGFVLEDMAGAPLDEQFRAVQDQLGEIRFTPPASLGDRIAPTEDDPWRGRVLRGEVHDENAAALGGVAAHAGLFGTATAVAEFARLVLRTLEISTALGPPELMRLFSTRTGVPGSSRALGWDTMLPTSSCGTRMSARSIGHTGFTGTSLWIDLERAMYVVLLTNRVHPTRANEQLRALRPRVHDAVLDALIG